MFAARSKSDKSELKALRRFGLRLTDLKWATSAFPEILKEINELNKFDKSFIALYQPESDRLQLSATEGFSATEFRRFEIRLEKPIFKKILESADPWFISLDSTETTFLAGVIESAVSETAMLYAAPIVTRKNFIGIIGGFGAETPIQAQKEIGNFLSVVAAMIAQAIRVEKSISGEKEKLIAENLELKRELKEKYEFRHIVGNSSRMRVVHDQVTQIARSNAAVLLRGESGTGKELIANAIHYNSLRAKKPFVKINCAALNETLIESELFGYEKGAFPDAGQRQKGRFELAEGGTLFLDEVGNLSVQTQVKLLRVLQEREFERLGGTETIKANVRLIAATNKNLEEAIVAGRFREDLYYRLNMFTIFLPPLRERKSDILLLAETFIEKYEREHGKNIKRISTPAIDMLSSYHYPGNVRELENAIERAVLVCDGSVIHGHHLPPTLQMAETTGTVTEVSLTAAVEAFEKDLIQDALKSARGNRAKAARLLNTTERILCYKIKNYKIEPKRFKN